MLFTLTVFWLFLVNANADSGCVDYHGLSEHYIRRNLQFNPSLVWKNDLASEACDVAKGANIFTGDFKLEAERLEIRWSSTVDRQEKARRTIFYLKDNAYNVANMRSVRPEFGCNSFLQGDIMKVVCLYRESDE
ncbi:hypothetical protein COOONC_25648 [Cooperia oncophora]